MKKIIEALFFASILLIGGALFAGMILGIEWILEYLPVFFSKSLLVILIIFGSFFVVAVCEADHMLHGGGDY